MFIIICCELGINFIDNEGTTLSCTVITSSKYLSVVL